MALAPRAQVGEYEVVKQLGAGAVGEVYEAVHPIIGKRVAIKVMKLAAEEAMPEAQRLLEEARAVNAIGHPGIIDIFGASVLPDGRPYLVMELLRGTPLDRYLSKKGALPFPEAFELLEGILEPLVAAHAAGVIHRDLKTTNIFIVDPRPGGSRTVKLLDFGVARREGREPLTHPEMTLGSIGFMGPEHLAGKVVPQSDLYSVGCVAWVLLTGQPVFPYQAMGELARNHLSTVPPRLSTVRAQTPKQLDEWVASMLAKDVARRPASAQTALDRLHEVSSEFLGEATLPSSYARVTRRAPVKTETTDLNPAFQPVDEVKTREVRAMSRPGNTPAVEATSVTSKQLEPVSFADELNDDEPTIQLPPSRRK